MSSSSRTLLVNAEVYSSSDPFATAVMIGALTLPAEALTACDRIAREIRYPLG